MPDGPMSPEQLLPTKPDQPKSSIEEFRKAGPSEEQMKAWQGPEWKSELPDIRMQLGDDDEKKAQERLLAMLLGSSSYGGRSVASSMDSFGKEFKVYEKSKTDEEKKEALEKMGRAYEQMMGHCIDEISDVYDKSIEQMKDAYPYDHRQAEFTISAVEGLADSLGDEEWVKSEVGKIWIKRIEQDTKYLDSFLGISVAQSASKPYYFDVVLQLQILKEGRYRAYADATQFEQMFAAEITGLEFTPNEKAKIKSTKLGLDIHEHEGLSSSDETWGLRELAIRMQDASFETRMKLAAVSQIDFTKNDPEKSTFMGDGLSRSDMEFYMRLFWRKDPNPNKHEGQLLSPYITSKESHVREINSIMESILLTGAVDRLRDISGIVDQQQRSTQISDLVKEVREKALARKSSWHTRDKDIASKLAVLITRQGYLQDFSFMHASKYCWEYTWKTDDNGMPIEKKGVDIGGIYTHSGDLYSLGWAQRKHGYDANGNSCTNFLLTTHRATREKLSKLSPYVMPRYTEQYTEELGALPGGSEHPDKFLRKQWEFLFSDSAEAKAERKSLGYEDLHPDVAKKLKEWAFVWVTAYSSKYLGEQGVDYMLEVPHFFPPSLDIANFFEAITTHDGKLNFGAPSIWRELVSGKRLSQINWSGMDSYQHDRWLVDLDMASRFMKVLIEPTDKEKDPIVGLLSSDPSTFAPKELAKRIRLTFRDSEDSPSTNYEVALIPFMIVLACANKHGLFSAYAWDRTTKEDIDLNSSNADRFFMEMAYWKRALKWLPGDRPGKDGYDDRMKYGNTMALLAEFYETVISRVAKSSSEESYLLARDNFDKTSERIKKLGYLNRPANKFQYKPPNRALEK